MNEFVFVGKHSCNLLKKMRKEPLCDQWFLHHSPKRREIVDADAGIFEWNGSGRHL